jgi:hypothetical protein
MDDAYNLIDIRQSCYKPSCSMPDEPQYDEKTDCSLTKTAQIIGMTLPGHPGGATSDRERVLAQGNTRLNGCVRHIIPGNAHAGLVKIAHYL